MTNEPIVIFEQIKKLSESQKEYWSARELSKVLDYVAYRNFETVIKRAKEACKNSDQSVKNHFVDVDKMIELGKTASREIEDILLTRYACYLVMQNADPSKEVVALGQTYFATQTDAKIRRESIKGEAKANQTHFEVGRKVRQTIKEIGGTMPEKLPISDGINKAKTRIKKLMK